MSAKPPGEIFYLKSLAEQLKGFIPPQGAFEPGGAWKQSWRVFTMVEDGRSNGMVHIAREPQDGGRALLKINLRFVAEQLTAFVMGAQVMCRADRLATPLNFVMNCRTQANTGQAVAGTELHKTGALRDGKWVVGRRGLALGGAHALNWGLFDAVQRLPRGAAEAQRFDLIKDFDELKPAQTLAWREALSVTLGGAAVELEAWQLTGEGTLPTIYYRDPQGRLLFVVSGLEGYILDSFRPAQGAAQ